MKGIIGFLGSAALLAVAASGFFVEASAQAAALQTQRSGAVEYVSGGVGENERAQMRASAEAYNLKVVTAMTNGAFINGAQLVIDDLGGTRLLDTKIAGPLFYASVPEGRYTVKVSANGSSQERSVRVGSGAAPEQVFTFEPVTAAAKPMPKAKPATAAKPRTAPVAAKRPAPARQRRAGLDDGISLYNLDPNAAQRARKQVDYFEVLPDGTTRPVAPSAGQGATATDEPDVLIQVEPTEKPAAPAVEVETY